MSGDRAAAAALIRCAIRDRVRRTGTYVRFRLRIALHALGQPAFLCRIAFRQKQNLIAPGSRSERASSQRVVKVASEISPRDDELKMLDAAMSRIMGDLDIPDLPPEVRAPLKLELGVLVQMWFDLHGERQKSSSIQIRTVLWACSTWWAVQQAAQWTWADSCWDMVAARRGFPIVHTVTRRDRAGNRPRGITNRLPQSQ
jgi:hypothetical protein